jgi:hypothetical protein
MDESETVKSVLKDLLDFNDWQYNPVPKHRTDDGPWHESTVNDVQQFNYEMLAEIADMLGMSDIYLDYLGGGHR